MSVVEAAGLFALLIMAFGLAGWFMAFVIALAAYDDYRGKGSIREDAAARHLWNVVTHWWLIPTWPFAAVAWLICILNAARKGAR